MIKVEKYALKKIAVSSIALFLIFLFYLIPTNPIEEKQSKTHKYNSVIYLLDKDNYVSRVNAYFDSESIVDEIKDRLNALMKGDRFFKPLIPDNVSINNVTIVNDEVTIDFSKEILNIKEEEHFLEALVYTLTEISGINNIYIKVDGILLEKFPNSNNKIDYPLTRSIGINKEYDLKSFNNIISTTIFFNKTEDNIRYTVPITKVTNSNEDKIEIIIHELKSSINSQKDLNGLINEKTKLIDYNISGKTMYLKFNEYLYKEDNYELISNSIFENYDVNKIIFKDENDNEIKIISRKTT